MLGKVWMNNENLKKLEGRIDDLIGTCRQLRTENRTMKTRHEQLNDEHSRLVEKTQIARTRIEAMIGRLKALERGS
jgi:cell division protein ZapB